MKKGKSLEIKKQQLKKETHSALQAKKGRSSLNSKKNSHRGHSSLKALKRKVH